MANTDLSVTPETQAAWRGIIAQAWNDEGFKSRLMDDPGSVLRGAGVAVPEGVHFVVVENEPNRVHLVLPAKPTGDVSISAAPESDYDPGF